MIVQDILPKTIGAALLLIDIPLPFGWFPNRVQITRKPYSMVPFTVHSIE
jgi:hypothetical protein